MTTVTFPAPDRGSLASVVGTNVRALMAARKVSQMQMATILGVTQTAVSKRLRGVTPIDTNDLQAISEAFGVHPMELLNEEFSPVSAGRSFPVTLESPLPVTLESRRISARSARRREFFRAGLGNRRGNERELALLTG